MSVHRLRQIFRGLQRWISYYEWTGTDEITDPDGYTWNLWDVLALYRLTYNSEIVTALQGQAIRKVPVEDVREFIAAIEMGVSPTNPVGMYATHGMRKMCA